MTLTPRIRNLYFHPAAATTFGTKHTIWVKPKYQGWQRLNLIAHEAVHIEQARAVGTLRFLSRYLLSRNARMLYEAEAYAESVRHGSDLYSCAEALSSPLYGWCCSYGQALDAIRGFIALRDAP